MKKNRCRMKALPMLLIGIFVVAVMVASRPSPSVATMVTMTKDICQKCHGTDDAVITSWHHVIRDANNWSCTMCHKTVSDGTGGYVLEVQRDCTVCHTPGYHTTPDGTLANRHHAIQNANDYGCLHCHPIIQDQYGNNEVVKTADCFFCHTDAMARPWREVYHLTNLATPTSADTTAVAADVTSKFYDTIEYDALEIVNTTTVDKALTVRFDKDAATISKLTLGFYVFELPNLVKGGTIRIYPYLLDGVTVDTSTYLDFKVSVTGWAQCDVTNLAKKMTGFTWMKFRVTALDYPIMISENQYQMTRLDTVGTNKIPIAEAGPDQFVNVGDTVTFIGGSSYDPDGTITSYRWDFGDGAIAGGAVASHVYTTPGVYFVALRVTDNLGATAEDYAFVNIKAPALPPNQPPIANAGPDMVATAGQPVTFSGAASTDPDGQIYSWTWSFDDGTSASGETVTKVYTSPGTYVATLTVTDTKGAIATDTVAVIVQAPAPTNLAPVADAGPDSYASVGATVTFSGAASTDADGTITSYNWEFGDGTTGVGTTATKIYNTAGIYVAKLTVTDNAGALGTDTVTITIHDVIVQNQPPVASTSAAITTSVGKTNTLSAAGSTDPDGSIASYRWDFGDGTSATGATVSKVYNSAGTFTAVLTVTDNQGATGTATTTVTVNANVAPTANAGPDVSVVAGTAATFSGAASTDSDGTIASYSWAFGDGTTATGVSATKTYTTAGTYTVTLTVTDNLGGKGTDTAIVTVAANKPPVANAGPDKTATVNKAVSLSASASSDPDGTIASYSWNFGNGTTGTGATVSKTYSSTGTYTVTLTVTDNLGAKSTDTAIVTVVTNQAPVANAGADVTATAGQTITFSGTGSTDPDGTISSYSWNFGDGSTTRTGSSVTKSYTTAGTYTVTLTVTDNGGKTATDTAKVTVTANKPPVANAGADVTAAPGQAITFSGAGSTDTDGTIASYSWNFGDGTTASGVSVTKTYTTAGTRTVTLTVTDNAGATATDTAVVTVSANKPPVANAGADVTATTGQTLTFSGSGSSDPDGTIASYSWNFGDGTTATGASVTKTYTTAGTRTVTLTVVDNAGATATDTAVVTVTANKPPVANAGADVAAKTGQVVTFSGSASSDSDGTIASYSWNFGDGTSATGVSTTKSYTTAGTRTVTLTVVDNAGATATDTAVVTVTANKPPVANAGADVAAKVGQTITLSGAASSDPDGTIASYSWNFGDGTSATGISATKSYTTAGTYTITLTVTDNSGATATDTAIATVTANAVPVAKAGADVTATTGQTITFSGAGSTDSDGTIASYAWSFGDGTSATGVSATKSYTTAGTYTVTLTVTDNFGATATDTAIVTVTAAPVYISADLGQQIANLSSRTTGDTSGSITDVTTKLRDGILTDTFRVDRSNVVTMRVNKDASTATQVILRVYVSSISSSQTLRIYPYNSNGTSLNTSYYVDATTSATGWKEIDVTSLATKMRGFGWMKFRITDGSSVSISEANFTIR